jgi:hypothetical protein
MSGGTNLVTVTMSVMGLRFSQRRQRKVTSRIGVFFSPAALVDFPVIDTPLVKLPIVAARAALIEKE